MSETELVGYFGYGSLVNTGTLATDYVAVHRARLKGWRRHWQHRGLEQLPGQAHLPGREIALLSVHRQGDVEIDGMLVIDRADHLDAVDLREARYDRVAIAPGDMELADGPDERLPERLYVYVGKPPPPKPEPATLIQSYLDTVMAGYLDQHGNSGLERFIETTVGFDRPIHADRHAPLYARAQQIDPSLADLFDAMLRDCGVIFEPG